MGTGRTVDQRISHNEIIIAIRAASDYCEFPAGDSPGFASSGTQRELARETEGGEGEGFAQHRITGRHVIGRRPSCLVGTDQLREKEPRGGGEEPVRKRGLRGCGEDGGYGGRGRRGRWKGEGRVSGWTPERGLVTRVECTRAPEAEKKREAEVSARQGF